MRFSTLISAAAFFELSIAGYVLQDDYMTDFYSNFNFFTGADPTEGFVEYVDEATARNSRLINSSSTSAAIFGVDVTNKTPNGRPSIRIESKKKYDNGLIVLDVGHMPFGCGTWPAFWTLGPNWPKGGEIDILEGVNEYTNNGMTLHTAPGCSVGKDTSAFSGSVTTGNCDVAAEGQSKNAGCSIQDPSEQSYGAGLNQQGGAVFAMEWNSDAISVYRFDRDSIPTDVLGDSPNPSGWGKPAAKFAGACDVDQMFAEQQIIIDTTFCGVWAGASNVWEEGSCGTKAATCEEWVRDNPQAFTEAYWEINALKVYQNNGKPPTTPSGPTTPPKSSALPVPVPSAAPIQSGYATIVQPIPSSKLVPGLSSKPVVTPGVPAQSSVIAAPPQVPSSIAAPSQVTSRSAQNSSTPGGPGSARPSIPMKSQINAAPVPAATGAHGLPGWNWPQSNGGAPTNNAPNATTIVASAPRPSEVPAGNTSSVVVAPTPQQSIAQPSNAPVNPDQLNEAAPIAPVDPERPVHTIYETVYLTVPAQAAATPAPDAKKARLARYAREHRRRWTQHNARL